MGTAIPSSPYKALREHYLYKTVYFIKTKTPIQLPPMLEHIPFPRGALGPTAFGLSWKTPSLGEPHGGRQLPPGGIASMKR